jgi:6-phosphogluconolactonase
MAGARQIIVTADEEALAKTATERLLARARQAGDRAAICLTGGSSPHRLYELLKAEPCRSALPWHRIHWFIGDERFVPQDDKLSNMGTALRTFLDGLAPPETIHPVDTSASNADIAAELYQAELARFYGATTLAPDRPLFDLVLMGLGGDGHTASLFPGAMQLEETSRWVVGVEEPKLDPFVPRVTLTFPTLASTREMLFLVPDVKKRGILQRVIAGDDLPAARANAQGDLVWLVTRAAAPENS